MDLLFGIIPAIGWGILPVVLVKLGGSADEQLLGTTIGNMLLASILFVFVPIKGDVSVIILCILSGLMWAVGQWGQYQGYASISVSKAMPLSSGLQIVGNTFFGVVLFDEWGDNAKIMLGISAVVIIIIGILFSAGRSTQQNESGSINRKSYISLILTTIGYWGYSVIPNFLSANETTVYSKYIFQAIGMLLASSILSFHFSRVRGEQIYVKRIKKLTLGGLLFGIAAAAYVYSLQHNGLIVAFTLSQMNVVISSILGIFILHENHANPKRLYVGLGCIVVGSVVLMLI
ncbi:GRP family sugar transporter [Lapidilactobacillus bayanensis]|uniref:GRP family sugar transporter n=1 Tax=Lapidilactobacillus bayanensis TaxID=2485998 RepID=UPI000F7A8842|nr:GRP family sugar transporter [Lapidilactobacillus bayanensis]